MVRSPAAHYGRRPVAATIARFAAGWLAGALAAFAAPVRLPVFAAALAGFATGVAAVRGRPVMAGALAGFMLSVFAIDGGLDDRLPAARDGAVVEIVGVVDDLPRREPRRHVLTLRIESPPGLPRRARLAWYEPGGAPVPGPGERWRFTARLRAPRGLANPGGVDWEGWMLRAGIGATGYISGPSAGKRIEAQADPWLALRARLAGRLRAAAGEGPAGEVLVAVVTGFRAGLPRGLREVLSATGTGHLLAISGLHVGLAAALGAGLAGAAARVCRSRRPRHAWAAAGGLLAAIAYASVAGAPVSARRAVLMLAAGAAAVASGRGAGPAPVLALAGCLVLAVDPLAVLDPGLWLSFGAVAAIVGVLAGRTGAEPRWRSMLRVQAVLSLAMVCLAAPWFGRVSLVSPLANLVAVPWFSVLVVPPALAAAAAMPGWPALGAGLAWLAARAIEGALAFLEGAGSVAWAWRAIPEPSAAAVACAAAGVAWLALPRPAPGRPLAACLLLPILAGPGAGLVAGEFRLHVLDVGQGLAVVVRTATSAMVYDAGPSWPGGDAGRSTVVPALRALGIRRLEALVLSHGDSDHAGGGGSVLDAFPAARVFAGQGVAVPGAVPCVAGLAWATDGVAFRFLAPPPGPGAGGRNDASCVLAVEGPGGTVLLTGDIERAGEARLLERAGDPGADVVVAPHHGSRSSSGDALVEATRPGWVVFAAGWRNRWGFPHPEVVERWRRAGAAAVSTDRSGAASFTFGRGGPAPPATRRERACRAWRDCGRVAGP